MSDPGGGGQRGPLGFRRIDPDASSGNPLLQRFPEPSRHSVRPRVPWKLLLVLVLAVGASLAAVRFLFDLPDQGDPEAWKRVLNWVEAHESPVTEAGAVEDLRDIIVSIELGGGGGVADVRAALIALYGLGSLNVGNAANWNGTARVLERDHSGSAFVELVGGVKLQASVRMVCPACKGSGTCGTCGGVGRRAAQRLDRGPDRDRREIGASKKQPLSSVGVCPACKGTGTCRECGGSGRVDSATRKPIPDPVDMQRRWAVVHARAQRSVTIGYWKARCVRALPAHGGARTGG